MEAENPAIHIENMASQEGLSLNDLCAEAGVARTTLTRWKNGSTSANLATIKKFEDAMKRLIKKLRKNGKGNGHA